MFGVIALMHAHACMLSNGALFERQHKTIIITQVASRLAWMLGPRAHEAIPPATYVWDAGMSGQALHGGPG